MKMTVVEVSKVLASVARVCECDNRVVFGDDGSYIKDKASGRMTPMHNRTVSMWWKSRPKGTVKVRYPRWKEMTQAVRIAGGWVPIFYDRTRKPGKDVGRNWRTGGQ